MDKNLKKLSGHYILCGLGRVGRNVANELEATRHRFVIVDENLELLENYATSHHHLHICGDASDDETLIRANIAEARGVFAITGDDSRNMMISLTAKQLNPAARVVARCNEVRNAEKLRKTGADEIVSPNFTGGMRIASAMLRPQVVSFLDEMLRSDHNLRVEQVIAPPDFKPRQISMLKLRSTHYILLAVRADNDFIFNPPPLFMVQPGHVLLVMSSPQGRVELENALHNKPGQDDGNERPHHHT